MERYDSVIIGAGHNGLVCAAYLARGGQRVLVVEAAEHAGGLAAGREFHPGYSASPAHVAGHFPAGIAQDLGLARGDADAPAAAARIVNLDARGRHVVVEAASLTGVDAQDEDAWSAFSDQMQRFAAALKPFWAKTMPRIGRNSAGDLATFAHIGLKLRRLGKGDMHEFLRIAALPARDLVDERFASELLKAALCWDGLIGSKMAPRSPNGAVLTMLYRQGGETWQPGRLISALRDSAESAGATLRTGTRVERVIVEPGAGGIEATGVELAGGDRIMAQHVISSADPHTTFFDLVGVRYLDIGFADRIRRIRSDGLVAKLHLALDGLPQFEGLDDPSGRLLIAPDMDAIEFAFDAAKYGQCPERPVLEVALPSLYDDGWAPAGRHVLSAHVMYVPYHLEGGWSDAARDSMRERTIDTLTRYAPALRDQIVASEFLAPPDIEQRYGNSGGHWQHGDFAMDQMLMMRPTYDAAQYRTPIPGLWLCGAGCHPAGDLTGLAGHNAARELLR